MQQEDQKRLNIPGLPELNDESTATLEAIEAERVRLLVKHPGAPKGFNSSFADGPLFGGLFTQEGGTDGQ